MPDGLNLVWVYRALPPSVWIASEINVRGFCRRLLWGWGAEGQHSVWVRKVKKSKCRKSWGGLAAWPRVESRGNVISSPLSADTLAQGRLPCWGNGWELPTMKGGKDATSLKVNNSFSYIHGTCCEAWLKMPHWLREGVACIPCQIREVFLGTWSHISVQGWRWAGRSCMNTQQVFGSFSAVPANLPRLPSAPSAWLCSPQSQECTAQPAWSCWALVCHEEPSRDEGIQTKQPVFYFRTDYLEIFTIEVLMESACSCQNVWLTCWFSNSPLLLRYLKAFPNIFFYLWGHNLHVAFLVC